jgi:RimJ/RimL family protein N-acetyltransferase
VVLDWGFRIAGLHWIGIECFSFNDGAKQIYERLGLCMKGCRGRLCGLMGGGMIM